MIVMETRVKAMRTQKIVMICNRRTNLVILSPLHRHFFFLPPLRASWPCIRVLHFEPIMSTWCSYFALTRPGSTAHRRLGRRLDDYNTARPLLLRLQDADDLRR